MINIKSKKGYYFSIDALIALIIVISVIMFIGPIKNVFEPEPQIQEDFIKVLSSIPIKDLNNAYAQSLISAGKITDLNHSVLDQIGEFYALSMPEANLLGEAILNDPDLNINENIGIYLGNELIASKNKTPYELSTNKKVARQGISGIRKGEDVKGYSSRALLSSTNKAVYFYFGGYVGDGNISALINYNGIIQDAKIEATFSKPFTIYINGNPSGSYSPINPTTPLKIDLTNYINNFHSGDNLIEFRPSQGQMYIGGGFIKVGYKSDEIYQIPDKKYLPGINGSINLYDSFSIPGDLTNLELFLHYKSDYDVFVNIGNTTVYNVTPTGETSVLINGAQLSNNLNYNALSNKTIPFRFGLVNNTYLRGNITENADVFSVTDISGSMEQEVNKTTKQKMIDIAKDANKVLVDIILNVSTNYVGLVGYETIAKNQDYHVLSRDNQSLNQKVTDWKSGGGTCICCGINKAAQGFEGRFFNRSRFIIVLTDGKANVKCNEQGTGDPSTDAILAACQAHDNYNITVHAVGFGSNADEATLQAIASCGGGNYYYSSINDLINLYRRIAMTIVTASYSEQTIIIQGGVFTALFPDSYILYDYISQTIPPGIVINAETGKFGNNITNGSFYLPNDATIVQANAISYSGSKWTNLVRLNNELVYSMQDYGNNYVGLGDPYSISLPIKKIGLGLNNLTIQTGLNNQDNSGGSTEDKVIYSIIRNIIGYSNIVTTSNGCTWEVQLESGENNTIKIPNNYSGIDTCKYTLSSQAVYNNNDALETAVYNLLRQLDLDQDWLIDTPITANDISIETSEVTGIPYSWETEAQIRVWR